MRRLSSAPLSAAILPSSSTPAPSRVTNGYAPIARMRVIRSGPPAAGARRALPFLPFPARRRLPIHMLRIGVGAVGRTDLAERVEDRVVLRRAARLIVGVVLRIRRALERGEQVGDRLRIVEVAEHDGRIEVLRRDRLALVGRRVVLVAAVLVELLSLNSWFTSAFSPRRILRSSSSAVGARGDERAADLREQLRRAVHREDQRLDRARRRGDRRAR